MRYLVLLLVLVAVPSASAIGLTAHAPDENATVDPLTAKFTFTATQDYRDVIIEECDFSLNKTVHKTIRINDKLGGSSRQFTANVGDGTYTWRILCRTDDGSEVWTETRAVHLKTPEQSGVETYSSGVIRGSLVHEFTIENVAGAEPLPVPNVRPGDYILVSVEVPPSVITKEYFVRGKRTQNDTPYLWLTSGQEDLYLYLGKNTTVPMQSTSVTARLTGIEGTKSHLIFYSNVIERKPAQNGTPIGNETVPDAPPEPPAPGETEETEETEEPETAEDRPQQERQGFFTWVLSMLARLFGA